MDFFKILNARESTYQKFYVELINEKPPNYEVFWLWLDFFANPWMNERVVPDNFFVEVTTGFTMIGWFLGESIQPRGFPYYMERAKPASKKIFKCVTEKCNFGTNLGRRPKFEYNRKYNVNWRNVSYKLFKSFCFVIYVFLAGLFCNLPCEGQPRRD